MPLLISGTPECARDTRVFSPEVLVQMLGMLVALIDDDLTTEALFASTEADHGGRDLHARTILYGAGRPAGMGAGVLAPGALDPHERTVARTT